MVEERRPPEDAKAAQQELDARIERLARQMAELINSAGPEQRQDLREYALGLIKEETEVIEAPSASTQKRSGADTNPLGMALLLGIVAIPMGILFFPVGLTMLAIAFVLGIVGVVTSMMRR